MNYRNETITAAEAEAFVATHGSSIKCFQARGSVFQITISVQRDTFERTTRRLGPLLATAAHKALPSFASLAD